MDLTRFGFREGFDPRNRFDKKSKIVLEGKEYEVSTVELGLDHSFGVGEPLYFETMVFQGSFADLYCRRYPDKKTAEQGHKQTVKDIKNGKLKLIDGYFEEVENG